MIIVPILIKNDLWITILIILIIQWLVKALGKLIKQVLTNITLTAFRAGVYIYIHIFMYAHVCQENGLKLNSCRICIVHDKNATQIQP